MSYEVLDSRNLVRRLEELKGRTKTVYVVTYNDPTGAGGVVSGPGTSTKTFDDEDEARKFMEECSDAISEESEVLDLDAFDEDEKEEMEALEALFDDDLSYYADDVNMGVRMVEKAKFQEYAEQYAEDVGAIKASMAWPYNHIDWEAAAEELAEGWSEVTFRGVDYYWRE